VSDLRCVRCQAPTDATLCWLCVDKLAGTLKTLTELLPELHTTISRQAHTTHAVRTRAGDLRELEERTKTPVGPVVHTLVPRSLPVDLEAADLYLDARRILTRFVAELAAGHGVYVHAGTAAHPEAAVAWIRRNLRIIVRRDPQAGVIASRLSRLRRDVEHQIDNHYPDVYAGPCNAPDPSGRTCGVDLHAQIGETHAVCQACGTRYDVAERRDFMLEAAREVWARSHVISAALNAWHLPITSNLLDKWISRDRAWDEGGRVKPWTQPYPPILQVATDYQDEDGNDVMEPLLGPDGKPVLDDGVVVMKQAGHAQYRVGDVIDRVVHKMRAEAARHGAPQLEAATA
jgi:hypothetical protein